MVLIVHKDAYEFGATDAEPEVALLVPDRRCCDTGVFIETAIRNRALAELWLAKS